MMKTHPDESKQHVVASKWSVTDPDAARVFFGFPPLRPYLIEKAFGPESANQHRNNEFWAEDILVANYAATRPIRSILSLCCGFGVVERRILSKMWNMRS